MYMQFFFQVFDILKLGFMHFHNRFICTWEQKHHIILTTDLVRTSCHAPLTWKSVSFLRSRSGRAGCPPITPENGGRGRDLHCLLLVCVVQPSEHGKIKIEKGKKQSVLVHLGSTFIFGPPNRTK
jgi:hypothetical protein